RPAISRRPERNFRTAQDTVVGRLSLVFRGFRSVARRAERLHGLRFVWFALFRHHRCRPFGVGFEEESLAVCAAVLRRGFEPGHLYPPDLRGGKSPERAQFSLTRAPHAIRATGRASRPALFRYTQAPPMKGCPSLAICYSPIRCCPSLSGMNL